MPKKQLNPKDTAKAIFNKMLDGIGSNRWDYCWNAWKGTVALRNTKFCIKQILAAQPNDIVYWEAVLLEVTKENCYPQLMKK